MTKCWTYCGSKPAMASRCTRGATIGRRIEWRMNVNQIARPMDYVHFLQDNAGKTQVLFREMLINVTNCMQSVRLRGIQSKGNIRNEEGCDIRGKHNSF